MKIIVLAGGISTERDVSLKTGTMVCRALIDAGHKAVLTDLFFGMDISCGTDKIFENAAYPEDAAISTNAPDLDAIRKMRGDAEGAYGDIGPGVIELCRAADIVFMALHGDIGENGKLQGMFDIMGIKYTGAGALGSAMAMHKGVTKQVFREEGILTPAGKVFTPETKAEALAFPLPCIVKPCSGGSSIGVAKAKTAEELEKALDEAFACEKEVLVEELISGRELTCGILGGIPLPPAEVIPKGDFYDYTHKYQDGWITEVCPAKLTDEETALVQQMTKDVFRALKLSVYSRMDYLLTEDGKMYCLEANTLPGMTPTSHLPQEAKAAGLTYTELCEKIIALSLEER